MADKPYYFNQLKYNTVDDSAFKEALFNGSDELLKNALEYFKSKPDGNKSRIKRIEAQLRKRGRA